MMKSFGTARYRFVLGFVLAVALAAGMVGAGAATAQAAGLATKSQTTTAYTPFTGNKSCADFGLVTALKIEAPAGEFFPSSGVYTDGSSSVTLTVHPTQPITFDFTSTFAVYAVLVKTGTSGYRYSYATGTNSDSGLESPVADSVSHIEFCVLGPTAVRVTGFKATRVAKGAILTWRSASEAGTLGFNVYRVNQAGKRVKLNVGVIAASASAKGAAYRFLGRAAALPGTRYWLQEVTLSGMRSWVGSARA